MVEGYNNRCLLPSILLSHHGLRGSKNEQEKQARLERGQKVQPKDNGARKVPWGKAHSTQVRYSSGGTQAVVAVPGLLSQRPPLGPFWPPTPLHA